MKLIRTKVFWEVIAAATALLMVAISVPGVAVGEGRERQEFQIKELGTGYSRVIDGNNDPGLGAGDVLLENKQMADPSTDEIVGSITTWVALVRDLEGGDILGTLDCTVSLEGGTVFFTGAFKFSDFFGTGALFPVTGGTGKYVGTLGTVNITAVGSEEPIDFLFEFSISKVPGI